MYNLIGCIHQARLSGAIGANSIEDIFSKNNQEVIPMKGLVLSGNRQAEFRTFPRPRPGHGEVGCADAGGSYLWF